MAQPATEGRDDDLVGRFRLPEMASEVANRAITEGEHGAKVTKAPVDPPIDERNIPMPKENHERVRSVRAPRGPGHPLREAAHHGFLAGLSREEPDLESPRAPSSTPFRLLSRSATR